MGFRTTPPPPPRREVHYERLPGNQAQRLVRLQELVALGWELIAVHNRDAYFSRPKQ